jgi:hypothetical protein
MYLKKNLKNLERSIAVRWRLNQKMQKMLKKKRGELIEPAKPIVYYIDPSTQINGKNILKQESTIGKLLLKQLVGKMLFGEYWPENDPTMSLEDARFQY